MTTLLRQAKELAKDVFVFGAWSTLDNQVRLRGRGVVGVKVPGVGVIHVRRGDSDYACVRQTFRDREYEVRNPKVEARILARYEEILASGATPVIVDAGANIGTVSLWFKKRYPRATVVAIEPSPGTAEILRRNLEGLDGMVVLEAALGSHAGFVSITSPEKSWSLRTTRANRGVPVVTVPDALARVPGGVPLIVKVDIEGFESDVFSENLDWINESYAVFIEPHDWMLPGRRTSQSFQRALGERDFEIFLHDENLLYVRP